MSSIYFQFTVKHQLKAKISDDDDDDDDDDKLFWWFGWSAKCVYALFSVETIFRDPWISGMEDLNQRRNWGQASLNEVVQ